MRVNFGWFEIGVDDLIWGQEFFVDFNLGLLVIRNDGGAKTEYLIKLLNFSILQHAYWNIKYWVKKSIIGIDIILATSFPNQPIQQ